MEIFGNLTINLQSHSIDDLLAALANIDFENWTRNLVLEKEIASRGDVQYCFSLEGEAAKQLGLEAADLWICELPESNTVYVTNILPNKKRELTRSEYNDILRAFVQELVDPACTKLGITFALSKTDVGIDDYLSAPVSEALSRFSGGANKSTGASHPNDQKRWHIFLSLHFIHKNDLPEDILYRWFILQGWGEDHAQKLSSEFWRSQELLKVYEDI